MGDFKNSNLTPVKLIRGYPVTLNIDDTNDSSNSSNFSFVNFLSYGSSRRSRRLTYLDCTEQESHDNTFKRHYKHGRASYRFPERKAFDVSMVPTWQLALGVFSTMLTRLTSLAWPDRFFPFLFVVTEKGSGLVHTRILS